MSENKEAQGTNISKAKTLDEIADFWDTNSLDEYWDETHEVEFEVRARPQHNVTLDPELSARIEEQAKTRGISLETLVNLWLAEHIHETKLTKE